MQVLAGTDDWLIQKETQDRTTSRVEGTYVSRIKKSTFLRRAKCNTNLGYFPKERESNHTSVFLTFQIYREFWDIYLSRTQPLSQWCGSSPHCTEPASACPDLWLSHSLWSSRRPHPAGCSPLNTHANKRFYQHWRPDCSHHPTSQILTTRVMGMMMRMMEMVAVNVHRHKWWAPGTHSSPAAACKLVCPWGTWSGPCCRQSLL